MTDLETLLQNISDILMNFQNAVSSDLDHTPILRETVDRLLAEINSSLPSSTSRDSQKGLPKLSTRHERFLKPMNPVDRRLLHMFGYQVSHQLEDEACEVEAEYPEPLHVSQPPFAQSTLQESRADPRVIICLGLVRWLAERNYSDQDLKEALQRMMESMLGLEDETDGDVDWLDCHDIGDYLAGLKITLDKSSILVDIPIETVALLEDTTDGDSGHPEYFLDVEHFLTSKSSSYSVIH